MLNIYFNNNLLFHINIYIYVILYYQNQYYLFLLNDLTDLLFYILIKGALRGFKKTS